VYMNDFFIPIKQFTVVVAVTVAVFIVYSPIMRTYLLLAICSVHCVFTHYENLLAVGIKQL